MFGYEHNGGRFTPADVILEKIVGSAYEWGYYYNSSSRRYIFSRLATSLKVEDEARTYVSPDRRHLYVGGGGGGSAMEEEVT